MNLKLITKSPTPGDADVLLDGDNIGPALTGITVRSGVHEPTQIELDLAAFEFEVQGVDQLWVNPRCVELLTRYGWTPPEGAKRADNGGISLRVPD